MESSHAIKRHLSTIKGHYEIVGHMFKGEAKNAIENKGKSNRVIKRWTHSRKTRWHAENFWELVK